MRVFLFDWFGCLVGFVIFFCLGFLVCLWIFGLLGVFFFSQKGLNSLKASLKV